MNARLEVQALDEDVQIEPQSTARKQMRRKKEKEDVTQMLETYKKRLAVNVKTSEIAFFPPSPPKKNTFTPKKD